MVCMCVCVCVCVRMHRLDNRQLKEELKTRQAHLEQLRALYSQLRYVMHHIGLTRSAVCTHSLFE